MTTRDITDDPFDAIALAAEQRLSKDFKEQLMNTDQILSKTSLLNARLHLIIHAIENTCCNESLSKPAIDAIIDMNTRKFQVHSQKLSSSFLFGKTLIDENPMDTLSINSIVKESHELFNRLLSELNGLTNGNLQERIDISNEKLQNLNKVLTESQSQLRDTIDNLLKTISETLNLDLCLLLKYMIKNEPEYLNAWIRYHASVLESMYMKAEVIKTSMILDTYTPSTIEAICKLKSHLRQKCNLSYEQIIKLESKLKQYDECGEEFSQLVIQYTETRKSIEKTMDHIERLMNSK